MKICKKCKLNFTFDKFHKDNTKSDGFYSSCKTCRKFIYDKYYQDNRRLLIDKNLKYYHSLDKNTIRPRLRSRQKIRLNKDPRFKLVRRLRAALYNALRVNYWKKNTHFSDYIGCSREELLLHIEKQFKSGMSWENSPEWHIDHIKPLSSAKTYEELISLCHYTNLQPLWAKDNISKGAKILP